MPLVLRQFNRKGLQDVNLRNFSHGQTSLDRLKDGLVGAQVPRGHTRCHHGSGGMWGNLGGLVTSELSYHSNLESAMTRMLGAKRGHSEST